MNKNIKEIFDSYPSEVKTQQL